MTRHNTMTAAGRGPAGVKPPEIAGETAKKIKPRRPGVKDPAPAAVSPEERHRWVAEAAYYIAERRGFAPGCEFDDWLQAEAEVERRIGSGTRN